MHDRYSPAAAVWALCWFPQVLSDKVARLRSQSSRCLFELQQHFPEDTLYLGKRCANSRS